MADPVHTVAEAPGQVADFAKKHTLAFVLLIVLAAIVILRYQGELKLWLVGLPVVGKFFAKAVTQSPPSG